jgi:hypothetical protein
MSSQRPRKPAAPLRPEAIDALYGLEPVYEPAQAQGQSAPGAHGTEFVAIQCPYCGERFETLVDLSAGAACYIEDCQVCCQPMELNLEVDDAGALASLAARRTD